MLDLRTNRCRNKKLAVLLFGVLSLPLFAGASTPYSQVDPRIGTAKEGQTYPVVGTPFAMTGWTPETRPTEDKCVSPYVFTDSQLTGFRGSHWLSGSCTQDYGSVTIMPTTGKLQVAPSARASSFRHQSEVMSPSYYSVELDRYAIRVEMTGTTRAGFFRMHLPEQMEANVLFEPNAKPGEGYVRVIPERHEIVGYNPVHRLYQGAGLPAGFSGYFVARFQEPFADSGVWCGTNVFPGKKEQKDGCQRLGAYVSFSKGKERTLLLKIGTSFTSVEEAEKNLDAEIKDWDFDSVQRVAEAAWSKALSRIEIAGGTEEQQKLFYTALYHTMLAPRIVSDADGTYNGFAQEGKLHKAAKGEDYYDDFSLWDTFRALHPLLTLLDPAREEQMINSLIDKGLQGGYLPIFPSWNSYTSEMIGDHAIPVIVDAYQKGLKHFDVENAYRLILQSATVTPPEREYKDGKGRRGLPSYLRFGFIPLEDQVLDAFHQREQVSRTLEYAYDDALIGDFAQSLGREKDAAIFKARALNWKNVIDPAVGFARGRHSDGSWSEPFQPGERYSYITEGFPWQYTFFVPQDIPGLIATLGGKKAFIEKLDGLFAAKLYEQGNEPSHHIAYLYNFAGAAWETQSRVREIMQTEFHATPDGLPGNDDAGQMSAWYVLSAMGFYPVCPGRPTYVFGSPIFSRVVIHLAEGKDFTLRADGVSDRSKYIQAVERNGQLYHRYEFSHQDIVQGATFTLHLGPEPNRTALDEN